MSLHFFFFFRPRAPHARLQSCLALLMALVLNAPAQASLTYTVGAETATVTTPSLSVTGSEWRRCPEGMTATVGPPVTCSGTPNLYTYTGALAAVAAINSALPPGEPHWHIPTAEYLSALLLSPLPSPLPTPREPLLDQSVFPDTPIDDVFWSSSPLGGFALGRLTVDFSSGSMSTFRFIQGTDKGYLRLVRPSASELLTVTLSTPGNGSVSPASASQASKANLIFDLTPAAGYQLDTNVVTSGDCLTSQLLDKLYVTLGTNNCQVSVTFSAKSGSWAISATVTPTGSGTLSCPATVPNLDDTDCYATPNTGFRLSHFTGCDASTGNTCHLRSVTGARNVMAVFEPAPASSNTAAIPTLGFWGLLVLSGLLGLGGLWQRRQGR